MAILDSFVGLIAPVECVACGAIGSALCSGCAAAEIVPYGERCFDCGAISNSGLTCRRCQSSAPRHVWISTNYDLAAKELIRVYKFGHQRAAAGPLTDIMVQTLLSFNDLEDIAQDLNYKIVSIPTATSRVRARSFDHSSLLARQIAARLNLRFENILLRLGQSRQVGAKRQLRLKQLEGKFLVRSPRLVKEQNILLIDDVVTTGATLRAATKVLRAAGAKRVDASVFAKRL